MKTSGITPSREQLNTLLEYFENGRFDKAEKLALSLSKQFPLDNISLKILGSVLNKTDRLAEARTVWMKVTDINPNDANSFFSLGNTLQELNRLEEARESYNKAIALKPDYAEAHNNLGVALNKLGILDDAERKYKQAIKFKPDYAEAYSNLGNTLKELNRLEEAEESYNKAIILKPDYAEAHNNLGSTLKELGRLEAARKSYNNAIALKSDYVEAYNNLGGILMELGRFEAGISAYAEAVTLKPNSKEIIINFSLAVKNVRFNSSKPKLYPIFYNILKKKNFFRPKDLAGPIISLLKHDPLIKDLLDKKNIVLSLAEATSIIKDLNKLPLLHHLMRICPIPDLQLEAVLVKLRKVFLKEIKQVKNFPELIYFLSSLCLHCFINEYVYFESDSETDLVKELEIDIKERIIQSEQLELSKILCLASYRPLYEFDWCKRLDHLDEEIKTRLIDEPLKEREIVETIPVLGDISDDISRKVREQYEENPYPRWVNLTIPTKKYSVAEVCNSINLNLYSDKIKDVSSPSILIAGCGTGQHSIETASRFSNCQVRAVDISLASLTYAQRKTTELGICNLQYLQADILSLNQLNKKFDIIESTGVLHHMKEPIVGWRVLRELLNSGGLMKIGLYSKLARRHIIKVRQKISALEIGLSKADIRNFRRKLIKSQNKNVYKLTKSRDFYTLSSLRDLIFHEQEHNFTIPQIQDLLDKLRLKFCGFEGQEIVEEFRRLHGQGSNICDLALWHQFEEVNPDSFAGMYQFWCQKL